MKGQVITMAGGAGGARRGAGRPKGSTSIQTQAKKASAELREMLPAKIISTTVKGFTALQRLEFISMVCHEQYEKHKDSDPDLAFSWLERAGKWSAEYAPYHHAKKQAVAVTDDREKPEAKTAEERAANVFNLPLKKKTG